MMKPMSISLDPVLTAPCILLFEVIDKERPLAQTAILYGILAVVGCLLSRKRWWWGLLLLPVVTLFASVDIRELHDPFVGPAIVREAGFLYVLVWHALMLAGFAIPILTAALTRRGKSVATRQ
jgi:hypothetical protein